MNLLVVRHARAEGRETFATTGKADSERPLTRNGIRRMKEAARGLRLLVPSIDLLVSSPFRRAVETARIIADAFGGVRSVERDELAPEGHPQQLIDWLAAQQRRKTICIVGHEPDLSELLAVLLADRSKQPSKLKKGSATLVRFDGSPSASSASLRWHRSARELASLG
jgi:phosphohistidine phosphatase